MQQRQLDILLAGFKDIVEFAMVLGDEACLDAAEKVCLPEGVWEWECSAHSKKLFALCSRMANYISQATVREGGGVRE